MPRTSFISSACRAGFLRRLAGLCAIFMLVLQVAFPGAGQAAAGGAEAVVDVVERLGWELHLHLRLGEHPLTAQVEAREVGEVAPGDRVPVRFSRYHLFDADSGEVIR